MAQTRTRVTDGFTSLEGGMDGGSATNLIPRNKVSFAMNATFRTGYVNNRPGWSNIPLVFVDEDQKTAYTTGRFQGGGWYIPDSGDPFAFVSVSGHIYRIVKNASSATVEDLTPDGDPNMSTLPQVWMCQADRFMVIQDGRDAPFIYDGIKLRRAVYTTGVISGKVPSGVGSTPEAPIGPEVPVGTIMAYGYGRLWVCRGKNFQAGDILDASIYNSAIRFTEVLTLQDSFAVAVTDGNITAMIFGANLDTSLGQGSLQVHTASGSVTTLQVTVDRASWTTSNIQQVGLVGGSSTGQNCAVNVNNDTWFRSHDGIRSFVVARREFNTWGNKPQSREVNNVLRYDTPDFLVQASGVWFDNRLLMTLSPQKSGHNVYFQGLSVLDFDLISTLNKGSGSIYSTDPQPAYDGIWSGLNISQITKTFFGSKERCFIFSWDESLGNGLWELSTEDSFDNGNCPIVSWLETGSYNFNNLTNTKKLSGADIYLDQLQGEVNFDFKWSPDQYPFWMNWQSFTQSDGKPCGTSVQRTNLLSCQVPVNVPIQYRSYLRLQEPDYQADGPETEFPLNQGYDFRFRVAWTGRCRIKGFRVLAALEPNTTTGSPP